ncbi:DUF3180 domain-containing protein [Tsukamurella sp. 8F]|uniref:DUF3180 domain-containing protein n=1 Tax=unclassified Tsukamurella TaxID=2633480 RepID=UPI0023B961F7|nr:MULTISPECIES: DUF3180 domain-containing protein [unclassified Tsukamurella]MDF0530915.1 DUF3180 domain-containing protein [Tsukamurella sp. 8J]MDF0588240.1 DUF3180 domain-containing protein [Tsukamurella sp. 8F]
MTAPGGPRSPQPDDDERSLRPTGWRPLVVTAVVVGVIVWGLVRINYGSLPSIPLLAGVSLYVVAGVEIWLAFLVRARVADGRVGIGGGRLHPIVVARSLVLAKASALLGAFAVGVWAGVLAYLIPEHDALIAAQRDLPGAAIGLVGAGALVAAALWLERCCRTPDDPEDQLSDTSPA